MKWEQFNRGDTLLAEHHKITCEYGRCRRTPVGEWIPEPADIQPSYPPKYGRGCRFGYRCEKHKEVDGS